MTRNRDAEIFYESALDRALKKYVYVSGLHVIAHRVTGELIKPVAFNAMRTDLAPAGATGTKAAFAVLMNAGAEAVDTLSYCPGKGRIVEEGSGATRRTFFNTWRAGLADRYPFAVSDNDVSLWLEHVAHILPDDTARNLFLDFCAFVLQNPGGKILWCFTLIGEHGTGKDLMVKPLRLLLGEKNFRSIGVQHIEKWTWWAESQVVLLEELPPFHKRDVYERMKPYIAGQGTIVVDIKGVPHYEVPNFTNWIAFSNHENALALPESDRRFFVYHSPAGNRDPGYYKTIAEGFEDRLLLQKIHSWLLDRDISKFNPGARPPMTEAKRAMIAAARDPVERYVRELFDVDGKLHGRELVTVKEILSDARFGAVSDGRIDKKASEALTAERVSSVLRRMGAKRLDRRIRVSAGDEQGVYLWAIARYEDYARIAAESTDDLRREFERDQRRNVAPVGDGATVLEFTGGRKGAEGGASKPDAG